VVAPPVGRGRGYGCAVPCLAASLVKREVNRCPPVASPGTIANRQEDGWSTDRPGPGDGSAVEDSRGSAASRRCPPPLSGGGSIRQFRFGPASADGAVAGALCRPGSGTGRAVGWPPGCDQWSRGLVPRCGGAGDRQDRARRAPDGSCGRAGGPGAVGPILGGRRRGSVLDMGPGHPGAGGGLGRRDPPIAARSRGGGPRRPVGAGACGALRPGRQLRPRGRLGCGALLPVRPGRSPLGGRAVGGQGGRDPRGDPGQPAVRAGGHPPAGRRGAPGPPRPSAHPRS